MISRKQLAMILARQWALRVMAAGMFCFASLGTDGVKKASADDTMRPSVQVAFNSSAQNYERMNSYPGLFGAAEKRSGNLKPFTKWTGVLARLDRGGSQAALNEWKDNLKDIEGKSLKEMARRVNELANAKPYISDSRNWGTSDYWETPAEFVKKGGDCEDFAIAKYSALKALGVPEDRMRLAIVHDNVKNIPHALLIVYTDEGTYALDNQNKSLVSANGEGRYRPIFSINRQGWWLHSEPGSTQVASAD